jgi:hypothetical protein
VKANKGADKKSVFLFLLFSLLTKRYNFIIINFSKNRHSSGSEIYRIKKIFYEPGENWTGMVLWAVILLK